MILSRAQLEEIAAAVTDDFDRFFFGVSPEEEREDILPTSWPKNIWVWRSCLRLFLQMEAFAG